MTRFSLNYKPADMRKLALANFDNVKKKHPDRLTESREEYIREMDVLNSDPVFRAGVRAVHILAELSKPIHEAICFVEAKHGWQLRNRMLLPNKQKDKENVDRKIFMIPGSKPETLRVFPEIWLTNFESGGAVDLGDVRNISAYFSFYLMHWYNETKKNPAAWNPLSRALTRMFKGAEVSVAAALQRYTKLPATMAEKDINKLAEHIINFRRPAEILEARTPADFIQMYGTEDGPQSCMTGHAARGWSYMVDHYKIHPTSWYAYTGNTFGLYMKKGDEVVARCIVYNKAAKGAKPVWEMGRLYHSTEFAKAKIIEEARKRGIIVDRMKEFFLKHADWEFDVPIIKLRAGGPDIIPMPFVDNLFNGFRLKYNQKQQTVTFTSDTNMPNTQVRVQPGYIDVSTIEHNQCSYCQRMFVKGIHSQDGNYIMCSVACMNALGYVGAMDADGAIRYVPKNQAYPLHYCGDKDRIRGWATTEDAAIRAQRAAPALIDVVTDKESEAVFLDREDDQLYYAYNDHYSVAFASGPRARALPLTIGNYRDWRGMLPKRVVVPFAIKQVAAVEVSDKDHYLTPELRKQLDDIGAEIGGMLDEDDVIPREVAPSILADEAPKGPRRERKSPVRFVNNLGD